MNHGAYQTVQSAGEPLHYDSGRGCIKRKGIIDEPGKRCLTDLCVNIIIPCNIVKSCLIEFDISIMKACGLLLAVGIVHAALVRLSQPLFVQRL